MLSDQRLSMAEARPPACAADCMLARSAEGTGEVLGAVLRGTQQALLSLDVVSLDEKTQGTERFGLPQAAVQRPPQDQPPPVCVLCSGSGAEEHAGHFRMCWNAVGPRVSEDIGRQASTPLQISGKGDCKDRLV